MKKIKNKILYSFIFIGLSVPVLGKADIVPCKGADCNFNKLVDLASGVMDFIITISVSVSAIMFTYAGFLYLTSAGDTGKIKSAHNIFLNVGIGLIVILSAWLIVKAILVGLGAEGVSLLGF